MGNYTVNVTLNGQDNLSDDLTKVNSELNDLDDGTTKASNGVDSLKTAALAMGAAFVANQLMDYVGQLNELGAQANNAERNFVQLSGNAETAAKTLSELQIATRGVVDDTTLMNGANRLLMMNLASTGDEAAKLTGIAVTLGKTMGVDAATSVGDFASMLANQSIPRLDNFGISSGKVRDRIEELKKAGMGMDEAFKTAVLEQGTLSIERLGAAAEKGATGVEKLQTRFMNLAQDLGQTVNNTLETSATTLDQIIQIVQIRSGSHPMQEAAREPAKQFAESYYELVAFYMDAGAGNTYRSDSLEAFKGAFQDDMVNVYQALSIDPTLAQNRQGLYDMLTDMPHNQKDYFIDAMVASREQQIAELGNVANNDAIKERNRQAGTAAAQKYLGAFADTWRGAAGDVFSTLHTMGQNADPANLEALRAQRQAIADANAELTTFTNSFSDIPAITNVMDETQTGTLSVMLEDAKTQLVDIQEAAKAGILQDSDVAKAQQMVDEMQGMQDKINEIQNMTLGGLLGTSSGGAMGELEAKILAEASAGGGLSERQLAELESTLDTATGKSTASSQTLDETIVPMIAEIAQKLGPDAAAVAMQNVTDYIKQGNYLGLDQATIAAGLDEAVGFKREGGAGLDGSGRDLTEVSGFDATAYANSLAESTESMTQLATDSTTMSDSMTEVNDQMAGVTGKAKTLEMTMSRITQGVYTVKVNLDISGLDKLNGLGIGSGGAGNGTSTSASNPRNNGGRVPGQDSRAAD